MTNREMAATDKAFRAACAAAGVEPTKRQASKFKRGLGQASRAARIQSEAVQQGTVEG